MQELKYKDLIEKLMTMKLADTDTLEEVENLVFENMKSISKVDDLTGIHRRRLKNGKRKSVYKYSNSIELRNLCQIHDSQSPKIEHDSDFC